MNEMWKIPDDVASATLERVFVRTADGWERRPPNPNRFFDFMNGEDGVGDPLATLRQITGPVVYVVCRPPGEAGMFATSNVTWGRSPPSIPTSASRRSSQRTA